MKHFSSTSISQAVLWLAFCFAITHAAPLEKRDANAAIAEIAAVLETVNLGLVTAAVATLSILSIIESIAPGPAPTTIANAKSSLSSIFGSNSSNAFDTAIEMISSGFGPAQIGNAVQTYSSGCNSQNNNNPMNPATPVFPQKGSSDAPYSLTEAQLREIIYIPSTFTYGKVQPLVMVPGTGSEGCLTFQSNFIQQFTGSAVADPVWLNIPGFMLNDAQVNSEYVAYAINYISGISNSNVSVIAWSQGNLDTQWAFKYWPSTRSVVNDFINISADFHGTQLAPLSCADAAVNPCVPSIIQQEYNSNFVTKLRSNGGDSAYVPSTSIYTSTDTVVQPQSGTGASAFLGNANGVAVTNNQIQNICPGQLAGSFYTHEGMLYNPIAYALAVDALTNPGPGQVSRLDLASICPNYVSPGLNVTDVVVTEENIPISVVVALLYQPKVNSEPPIMSYATY